MSYVKPRPYDCESFLLERDAQIVRDSKDGLSGTQIAEKHRINRPRVLAILRRARQQEQR